MQRPIVLAAGGTGGHIFPAEALAEALTARGEHVVLITDARFAGYTGAFSQIEVRCISTRRPSGKLIHKLLGMITMVWGTLQAIRHLRGLRPKVVVGFGGYPSFPTMMAAACLRLPTLIHEQNAVMGRVNRLLARRGVTKVATSFPNTLMLSSLDQKKSVLTGNPVRAGVRAVRDIPYPQLTHDGKMHILVTGGSQGASVFSQILPAALAALPVSSRARLRIDQQCREADLDVTRAAYEQLGVSVQLSTFFTDIPARLAAAHLVIARSGASTLAELTVAGRPAILVPYPQAMDNHQYFNANAFEDAGGGWVMSQEGFTASALSARLEALLGLPSTLTKAADAAKKMGRPDAAKALADAVLGIAQ